MAVFGEILPLCVCCNPRSAAKDVLEADAYLQCSLRNGFSMLRLAFAFSAALAMFACFNSQADAAQCGSSSGGFAAWKQEFAGEARAKGIGAGDHPGADGDELRAGDHQCRPRPAQFQSLARSVSRQARCHDHRRARAPAEGSRRARCSLPSSSATACRRGRCSRSGAWRPGSAASAATRTCSPRSRRSPMTAGARPISPSTFTRRCN